MTLREAVEKIGYDEPLECAFIIAACMRSAVQGEPSTYEGDCASIRKAREHFDTRTADGIRAWMDDLGQFADFDFPDSWWINVLEADANDEEASHAG